MTLTPYNYSITRPNDLGQWGGETGLGKLDSGVLELLCELVVIYPGTGLTIKADVFTNKNSILITPYV
jgi:hypothetical protein